MLRICRPSRADDAARPVSATAPLPVSLPSRPELTSRTAARSQASSQYHMDRQRSHRRYSTYSVRSMTLTWAWLQTQHGPSWSRFRFRRRPQENPDTADAGIDQGGPGPDPVSLKGCRILVCLRNSCLLSSASRQLLHRISQSARRTRLPAAVVLARRAPAAPSAPSRTPSAPDCR